MNKKMLLILSSFILALASCNQNNVSSNDNEHSNSTSSFEEASNSESSSIKEESSSSEDTSSSEVSSSTTVDDDNKYYNLPDWGEVQVKCGIGGDLIDLAVRKKLVTNCEYSFSFTLSDLPNEEGKEVVESSNNEVLTIEKVGASYKIHPIHKGKAFIRITDSTGFVRYCVMAEVADPIPVSEMEEYLVYEADYWKSYAGYGDTFVMTFYENGKMSLTGNLSNEPFVLNDMTYEYTGKSTDGKEYYYQFTDTNSQQYSFKGFNLSANGDFIYLLSNNGLDGILIPSDRNLFGEE